MLREWLRWLPRTPSGYPAFGVMDVEEHTAVNPAMQAYLADLLRNARFNADFLKKAADILGWGETDRLVADLLPRGFRVRRGMFGEALSIGLLEEFEGYVIPIPKLRYAITSDQTLPGTDAIGFRIESGAITEACFIEAKLRTAPDTSCAVQAHDQLAKDVAKRYPDILTFTGQRLEEEQNALYPAFLAYLADRRQNQDLDTFCIVLVFDLGSWSENCLRNLQDREPELEKLAVPAVRLVNLRQFTDDLFSAVGAAEVIDDD